MPIFYAWVINEAGIKNISMLIYSKKTEYLYTGLLWLDARSLCRKLKGWE
jgi:hypothetical protein